jgi:tRNA dimethylallyltransferase
VNCNNTGQNKFLIAIVGPTGVGKSHLAIQLACLFNGEIVNGDSRQVYRKMDIGTAKPTPEDMAIVPHHLFNIIEPDESFSLAQYQELAKSSIHNIQSRQKIPFLVGGSGQYIWSILEGWDIPRIPPDPALRNKLEEIAAAKGINYLYEELQKKDPNAANKIDKRNIRRVIRALEVTYQTNVPISSLQKKILPGYKTLLIGLTSERKELYQRIDKRVDKMVEQGLIAETQRLYEAGYDFNLPSMSSIGYKQIVMMLKGEVSQEEAIRQIKTATHRFVRHQYAWFRLDDKRICWFDVRNGILSEVMELIDSFIYINK